MIRGVTPAALVVALGLTAVTPAGGATEETRADPPQHEMTTFQLVLLWRGDNREPIGERGIQALQEGHLALIGSLLEEGRLIAAGPLDGGGDLQSVMVLDVPDRAAAEAVVQRDPWVESGRRRAEIHTWWTAKGVLRKPPGHLRLERSWLALLRRPPGAPAYDEPRLREIQAGHMDNIRRMAASGDLVLAGPMGDDGELRGLFLFRNVPLEGIRERVAADPAVRAGRLGVEIYPWHLLEGTLPPR